MTTALLCWFSVSLASLSANAEEGKPFNTECCHQIRKLCYTDHLWSCFKRYHTSNTAECSTKTMKQTCPFCFDMSLDENQNRHDDPDRVLDPARISDAVAVCQHVADGTELPPPVQPALPEEKQEEEEEEEEEEAKEGQTRSTTTVEAVGCEEEDSAFGSPEGATRKLEQPRQKVTMIVPVRNRADDVTQLIDQLLNANMPCHHLEPSIFIAEQVESYAGHGSDAWNKGRLYNAAVAEIGDQAGATIIFQDTDVWELCPQTLKYELCLDGGAHRLFGYMAGSSLGTVMGEFCAKKLC
jgi:hypothetical protein